MSAKDIILQSVVPALGAIISTAMYASPLKAVMKASAMRNLGDLNPLPFAITVANTIIWLTYGLLKHDPYITAPNTVGVVMAVFCTLTGYALADDKTRTSIRNVMCANFTILPVLGVFTAFVCSTHKAQLSLWGISGNLISLVYYGAPLSTMAEVIKTKNSASILIPLTTMNIINALLWTIYGLAVVDFYVWAPNGVGLLLSLAQAFLAMIYPARPKASGYNRVESDVSINVSEHSESRPMIPK